MTKDEIKTNIINALTAMVENDEEYDIPDLLSECVRKTKLVRNYDFAMLKNLERSARCAFNKLVWEEMMIENIPHEQYEGLLKFVEDKVYIMGYQFTDRGMGDIIMEFENLPDY